MLGPETLWGKHHNGMSAVTSAQMGGRGRPQRQTIDDGVGGGWVAGRRPPCDTCNSACCGSPGPATLQLTAANCRPQACKALSEVPAGAAAAGGVAPTLWWPAWQSRLPSFKSTATAWPAQPLPQPVPSPHIGVLLPRPRSVGWSVIPSLAATAASAEPSPRQESLAVGQQASSSEQVCCALQLRRQAGCQVRAPRRATHCGARRSCHLGVVGLPQRRLAHSHAGPLQWSLPVACWLSPKSMSSCGRG